MFKRYLSFVVPVFLAMTLPVLFSSNLTWLASTRKLAQSDLVTALPYLFLVAAGLLAYQMNFRKMILACGYLVASLWVMTHGLIANPGPLFLISAPLSLAWLAMWTDKRFYGRDGALHLAGAALPAGILWAVQKYSPQTILKFYAFKPVSAFHLTVVPQVSLFLAVGFACLAFTQNDRYMKRLHGTMALGLLPLYYVLEMKGPGPTDLSVAYLCYSALLLFGAINIYLQKIYLDELTGIPNRRALNEALTRLSGDYTVAMIDIDHFKKFNDSYGHEEGDNVLRLVGQHVYSGSKGQAYRYGGEEFTILYPGQKPEMVHSMADYIRQTLADRDFYLRSKAKRSPLNFFKKFWIKPRKGQAIKVTISIGLAGNPEGKKPVDDIFKLADQCLYEAKEKGRNCVVAHGAKKKAA